MNQLELDFSADKNRRNLYIKQEDYDYLAQIGNGYADGLRKAVEAHKELNAGQTATSNDKAERRIRNMENQ